MLTIKSYLDRDSTASAIFVDEVINRAVQYAPSTAAPEGAGVQDILDGEIDENVSDDEINFTDEEDLNLGDEREDSSM